MDRGTRRVTAHGVTNSQTQLKQLSTHACTLLLSDSERLCEGLDLTKVRQSISLEGMAQGPLT